MRTLVVYYSRTGNTRLVAEEIAVALGADVEELKERVDRSGKKGYLRASRDALRRTPADLEPVSRDPGDYSLVIIGGPIWVQTICTPARSYAQHHKNALGRVAFFATAGSSSFAERGVSALADAAGREPVATLALSQDEARGDHSRKLAEFLGKLTRLAAAEPSA